MKRIVLIIIFVIFIPIIILFVAFGKDKLPELINFRPEKIVYQAKRPIYFKVNNNLYYNENGRFEKSIKLMSNLDDDYIISKKFVSPDSKFILVYKSNKIFIISNSAKIIDTLALVKSGLYFDYEGGKFWNDNIQWTEDSKAFIIAKDESEDNTFLYKYTLDNKKLSLFLPLDVNGSYYLSRDEKNIYRQLYNDKLKKSELVKTNVFSRISRIIDDKDKLIEKDSVFINYVYYSYDSYNLHGLCDTSLHVITKIESEKKKGGVYIYNKGKLSLLIHAKNGYNSEKSHYFNIMLSGHSCFLPGDRYFFLDCESDQNKGSIIIDIENMKYMEIDKIDDLFFSLTNNDYDNGMEY